MRLVTKPSYRRLSGDRFIMTKTGQCRHETHRGARLSSVLRARGFTEAQAATVARNGSRYAEFVTAAIGPRPAQEFAHRAVAFAGCAVAGSAVIQIRYRPLSPGQRGTPMRPSRCADPASASDDTNRLT
jgi:hypothetical protein